MKGGSPLIVRYGREKLLMPSGYRITPAVYAPRRLHSPCDTTVTPPGTRFDQLFSRVLFLRGFCRVLWTRGRGRDRGAKDLPSRSRFPKYAKEMSS